MPNNTPCVSSYIGAKNRLGYMLSELIPYEGITDYWEPFGGCYNVGLQKVPHSTNHYNDLNPKLYTLFFALSKKDTANELLNRMLKETKYSEDCFNKAYDMSNHHLSIIVDPVEAAMYVWVTLLQSYNGQMKQWAGFHSGNEALIYLENLIKKHDLPTLLDGLQVHNENAIDILSRLSIDPHSFAYCDPVYTKKECSSNKQQYEYDMTDSDQWRFVSTIQNSKAFLIVSGYKNEIYDSVLNKSNGWYSYSIANVAKTMRIGCLGESKSFATEYIWTNYDIEGGFKHG
jgi:Site-specific DNA methylase